MDRRRLALQSLALAVALTWPAVARLGTEALGSAQSDTPKHLWTLWWMREELLRGTPGLETNLVNYPEGLPLWPIEPLHGIFALLLPIGPVALSNLLAMLHVFLVGLCAGWLGWIVTRRSVGALVAGALAQACAFTAFTLHVGVGELRQFWWLPLGMAVLLKAQETLRPAWFAALGAVMGLATLSCFYHGFFLAIAVSVYALATPRADRRLWLGYLGAATLALGIVVPVVRSFAASYAPQDAAPKVDFLTWMTSAFPLEAYPGSSLELPQLLTWRSVEDTESNRQLFGYSGGRYLGGPALVLAGAGLAAIPRRAWPWALVALVGTGLALGTVLWWDGAMVQPRVVLPLAYLNRALAFVAEPLNFPVRFMALPMLAVAVLGAFATRWKRASWLAAVVVLDMTFGDAVPWPRATMPLPSAAPAVAPPGGVVDLSFATRGDFGQVPLGNLYDVRTRVAVIGAQVSLERPVQVTPVERVDRWGSEGLAWSAALPLAKLVHGESVSEEDIRASVALLRAKGFGAAMITHPCDHAAGQRGGEPQTDAIAALTRALGAPSEGACASVWALPEVRATEAELARWTEAQQARLGAIPQAALPSGVPLHEGR